MQLVCSRETNQRRLNKVQWGQRMDLRVCRRKTNQRTLTKVQWGQHMDLRMERMLRCDPSCDAYPPSLSQCIPWHSPALFGGKSLLCRVGSRKPHQSRWNKVQVEQHRDLRMEGPWWCDPPFDKYQPSLL